MSLIAFLNGSGEPDGFTGGELRFYVPQPGGEAYVRVPGRIGQFYAFASHLEHEVVVTTGGERLTLVSWLY